MASGRNDVYMLAWGRQPQLSARLHTHLACLIRGKQHGPFVLGGLDIDLQHGPLVHDANDPRGQGVPRPICHVGRQTQILRADDHAYVAMVLSIHCQLQGVNREDRTGLSYVGVSLDNVLTAHKTGDELISRAVEYLEGCTQLPDNTVVKYPYVVGDGKRRLEVVRDV